ncbi:hypothetical protein ABT084_13725 [Streptomyces sp. NPDC002138]|uniref:hypothetical protein n=1 Tax=Streptomyces sp. NPDC002138 TaxID=3154410 RepID=UPI00331CF054
MSAPAFIDRATWPTYDPTCGVCTALDAERHEAADAGEWREVGKINQEIGNHPHMRRRARS